MASIVIDASAATRRSRPQRSRPSRAGAKALAELRRVLAWYLERSYGQAETSLPFYCEPARIGALAVPPQALAAGDQSALFRLFVALSMYQALRDVVIMRQQRELGLREARCLVDLAFLERAIARTRCSALSSADEFERGCDVRKVGTVVDCAQHPGLRCHVKDATVAFNRMGDLGKLPTSAFLRCWKDGLDRLLQEVAAEEACPARRAELLVDRFASVHRVGRKLATLFVSALSTPALAPGLTPWFPEIDGNELVVVDTNVARAVDALRDPGAPRTYRSREQWLCEQAAQLDLREFRRDLPGRSPRLVQQALYVFGSRSNRISDGDPCASSPSGCETCAPTLCPFVRGHSATRGN